MRVPFVVIITILLLVACSYCDARKAPAEEWLDEYILRKMQTLSRDNRFFSREFDPKNWGLDVMVSTGYDEPVESGSSSKDNKNPYFTRDFNPARNWLFDLKHDESEPDARKAPAEDWLDKYITNKIQMLSRNNRFFTREFDKSNWGFVDMSIHYKPEVSDSSSGNNKNPYFSREFNPARNWLFDLKHDETEPDASGSTSRNNKNHFDLPVSSE